MYVKQLTVKLSLYKCDQCEKEFKRYVKDAGDIHLCSTNCVSNAAKRGGVIWLKTSKTCMERHGVETPFASSVVMDKHRQTCLERYGVENVMQILNVQLKAKQTCLERYGVENVLASDAVRQKIKNVMFERYGINYPQQLLEIRERTKKTNVKRYGVENTLQLPVTRERCNTPETHAKRHQTMKCNGTYAKSKPEDRMYELLCKLFGFANVERQVTIHKWPIDFYVKSIDVYVQLDGVYWHGLDRPIEVIAEHKTNRDVQIHKKWSTDREQDQWFSTQGLKLVRITDVQLCNLVNAYE